MSESKLYVLTIFGGVEAMAHGPYLSSDLRNAEAKKLYEESNPDSDSIFWLDVAEGGDPDIGSYSVGYLEDE